MLCGDSNESQHGKRLISYTSEFHRVLSLFPPSTGDILYGLFDFLNYRASTSMDGKSVPSTLWFDRQEVYPHLRSSTETCHPYRTEFGHHWGSHGPTSMLPSSVYGSVGTHVARKTCACFIFKLFFVPLSRFGCFGHHRRFVSYDISPKVAVDDLHIRACLSRYHSTIPSLMKPSIS